jgi:hypothetical protein
MNTVNLQHEYDSTQGLWATDRPEVIPVALASNFFRIGFPKEKFPIAQASEETRAAMLNARTSGMVADNKLCEIRGEYPIWTKDDFEREIAYLFPNQ